MTDRSHAEIIDALGGAKTVSERLGINPNTVLYWTREGRSIPVERWPDLLALDEAGCAGVTLEELMAAKPPRKARHAAAAEEAA